MSPNFLFAIYFNREDVNSSKAIPNTLTATRPMPTINVSPLKIFLRKFVRGSGVSVMSSAIKVGDGANVLVAVGEGARVVVLVTSPVVPVVPGVSCISMHSGMISNC